MYFHRNSPIWLFTQPVCCAGQNEKDDLLFFVDEPTPTLKDNPLALLFADDYFFAASYDSFNGFDYFFRHQSVALISLCVPLKWIIGVSVQGGLNPPTSP